MKHRYETHSNSVEIRKITYKRLCKIKILLHIFINTINLNNKQITEC